MMKKSVVIIVLLCIYCTLIHSLSYESQECCKGPYTPARWVPYTVYDYTTPFNEKRYWLETNETTGEIQICYQRIDLYPQYFMTPQIHCYRAHPVHAPDTMSIPTPAHCWKAGNIILCKNDFTGEMSVENIDECASGF